MCRVIDDIYKAYCWEESQQLDLEDVKIILTALFIAPPSDVIQQTFKRYNSINKNNLNDFIRELEQYKLQGSDFVNLIKDFSTDFKINTNLFKTILIENGMNKQELDELLLATLGNDYNNDEINITNLAQGLNSLSNYN